MASARHHRCGFSLVEVNVAILLISMGVMTLLALFPQGLRESDMGLRDTHEALFADTILATLEANAQDVTNWSRWVSPSSFRADITAGMIYVLPAELGLVRAGQWKTARLTRPFPPETGEPPFPNPVPVDRKAVEYELAISDADSTGKIRSVQLRVRSGRYGAFDDFGTTYFTSLVYMGM